MQGQGGLLALLWTLIELGQRTFRDGRLGMHKMNSQYHAYVRLYTWETCGRKENTDGIAPGFGKCRAFLGFKELADGRVHRLLGTSMKANIFLREDVLSHAYERAVGDAEVLSVSTTNGK